MAIARLQERLVRGDGDHVHRDGHGGAAPNLLLAQGCLIPAVVPLAF
ncbi:MAG TPA: hypothetical protein VK810_01225 [Dongiaceae bacterium]|nr:hypothetical protein [Dongiaceae bacterium]